jgi:hypothetical protein
MGLFKRMKDSVKGTGKVVSEEIPTSSSPGSIRLIVTAEGVPPTPVEFKVMRGSSYRHLNRWPRPNDSIPVTVDRANPQKFSIEWSEMVKSDDRTSQEQDQREQAMLAQMRGAAPPDAGKEDVEEARQMWRENLAEGSCTQTEFDKEMRELDEVLRRAQQ